MTRLVPLTYHEVIQRLHAAGFEFDRQAKGSHEICTTLKRGGAQRRHTMQEHCR